jgi:hypothetical protein
MRYISIYDEGVTFQIAFNDDFVYLFLKKVTFQIIVIALKLIEKADEKCRGQPQSKISFFFFEKK